MPRADKLLAASGLCPSRTLAAKLIEDGAVTANGRTVLKPSEDLPEDSRFEIASSSLTRFVSRGGLKLEAALNAFGIDPEGDVCADIGASTGGFTDCLLQRGAKKVYAVDSGKDQLHPSLKNDRRVISMENTNARDLTEKDLEKVDLVVMDVSFISQALLYEAVLRILKPGGVFLSLIKPQFEAGREHLNKNGVVKSEKTRLAVLEMLKEKADRAGLILKKTVPSPLRGGDGNTEYLALFERKTR